MPGKPEKTYYPKLVVFHGVLPWQRIESQLSTNPSEPTYPTQMNLRQRISPTSPGDFFLGGKRLQGKKKIKQFLDPFGLLLRSLEKVNQTYSPFKWWLASW